MRKPNILYIMSDDHAANAVSCYGSILSSVFRTPNLDSIADEGTKLDCYFSTNAICTPARATIMTGQYGGKNGVRTLADEWHNCDGLNLAKLMQGGGYETALFGKWHLGVEPVGFDRYSYLSGAPGDDDFHYGQQGLYRDPYFKSNDAETSQKHEGYVTDIITDMTLDYLKTRDSEKPFFLMCHHKAPHDFWDYPERHEHLFDGVDIPVPDSLFEDRAHRSEASRDYGSSVTPRSKVRNLYNDFSDPDYVTGPLVCPDDATFEEKGIAAYTKYMKDYLRTVKGIDDSVGEILAYLKSTGEIDNTVIIYTSDQGMFLGEHDYQDKRWSFEESLRAPFMIRYPSEIAAGRVENRLMANIDIAPTLLDYAGIAIPTEMQGESSRRMIAGDYSGFVRDSVYFRYWMHRAHRHDNPAHYGIRTDDYKLIFYYGLPLDANGAEDNVTPSGYELYDMKNDPLELRNLYNDPKYADVVVNMKKRLNVEKERYDDTDERYPELIKLHN